MVHTSRKPFLIFIVLVGVIGLVFGWSQLQKRAPQSQRLLPTYFSYSQKELSSLEKLKSPNSIEVEDLWRWDDVAFETVGATKTDATVASKFYAYLMVAQRDAAYLSRNARGQFKGSIDPVSKQVVCLFFSDSCSKIPVRKQDDYSEALAKVVLAKVQGRIEEDKRTAKPYQLESGDEFWAGKAPFKGLDTGSWKPWLIPSARQFRLPPPPDFNAPEGRKHLEEVKGLFAALTNKQKYAIAFWAGGPGTKTPPGVWLQITSNAIKKENMNLERALFVRSVFAMGLADTEIAALHLKYTYWAKRPFMIDDTIITFMPTPNHPSYPSDSSAVAGFSAAILNHYFPEETEKWNALTEEAVNSRINSGIHFRVDVEQGVTLGRKVAEAVIRRAEEDARPQ